MASTVFNLGGVKILKNILRFQTSDVQIITGNAADPTVTAVDAVAGSIYIRANGEIYIKNTSGSNTDFNKVTSQAALDAHVNALTDAHDASAISNVPAGNLAATDVQGALNELQSDVDTRALDSAVIKKDGSVAFTAAQSMGGFKLTSLAAGTASSDAVNKGQLDAALEGLKPKAAARVATTANIVIATDLNAGDVIDGITLANGDRVLVKDQTAAEQNGIYVVSATPARSTDFDSLSPIDEINGSLVAVQEGTANAGKVFVQSGVVAVLDTDPINFVFFNSSSTLVGGDGITVSGSNISVDHDGEGLTFVATQLALELDGSTLTKSATGLKVSDATLNAKANVELNNLATTSINANLIPNVNVTRDLGTSTERWRKLFVGNIDNATGVAIDVGAQALTNNGTIIASWNTSGLNITSTRSVAFRSPNNLSVVNLTGPINGSTSATYRLPSAGTAGQYLQLTGDGTETVWTTLPAGYTDEQAQDAVGNILIDSATIDFTYDDATPTISAVVIDGSITNAKIATGIDAVKIADGSVSNVEFQYLDGVTSSIQTQLNDKASTTLNNLGTTSINADLLPNASGTLNLGSTALPWSQLTTNNIVGTNITLLNSIGGTARGIIDATTPRTLASGDVSEFTIWSPNLSATDIGIQAGDPASGPTGSVFVSTGNASINNNSGNIKLYTGTVSGTGVRGDVSLDARSVVVRSGSEVRFNNTDNTFYTALKAGTNTANLSLTLPIADGSAGHLLQTNGSGVLSFVAPPSAGITTLVTATNVTIGSNVTNEVVTGLTFAHASFNGCEVRYRIKKGTLVRTGTFLLATDGTEVAFNDAFVETVDSTIVFEAVVNGANINIRHTNTETGTISLSFEQNLFPV